MCRSTLGYPEMFERYIYNYNRNNFLDRLEDFWLCKEFLGDMIKDNRGGHIVNVSSACGQMGAYKLTDYCATKFAVVGFTESLRIELKIKHPNANVKCTTVCPFHVKTKLFDGVKFSRLSWLNLSMDIDFVCEKIFNGILMEKELILVPHNASAVLYIMRQLVTAKFFDHAAEKLDLNGAMDSYKKKQS